MLLQPPKGLQLLLVCEDGDRGHDLIGPQGMVQLLRPRVPWHGWWLLHQRRMLVPLRGLLLLRLGVLLLPLLSRLRMVLLRLLGQLLLLGHWRVLLLGRLLRLSCMRTLWEGPAVSQRNEVLVGDEVACRCFARCWGCRRCCCSGGGCCCC